MINIKDLPFQPIPASEAENVLKAKNGFLSLGGAKKKFAKCIEEGKAALCEVAVVTQFWVDDDDTDIPYGAVLTPDKSALCSEGVMCVGGKGFFSAPEAPYERFDVCEALENDEAKRRSVESKPGFVIHYFLGKDEYYKLIVPEWAKDLKLFVPEVDSHYGHESLVSLE